MQLRRDGKLLFCALLCAGASGVSAAPDENVLGLELEQLGAITMPQSATITPTSARRAPASVTVIDRRMIRDSGARNLFDLLETFTPNFHYLPHQWEAPHMGMRGLIGDRDDKYLIVLNGRVLNEKTHIGALSERDLPMLDDISRIDVVRGPGSVVYGPGAVSMVISIQTESFADNTGDASTVKLGAFERFQSLEMKKALTLSGDRHGLLLYAGISAYQGAGSGQSPLVYGNTFTTSWGETVQAGQPVSFPVPNNHEAWRDQPKLKLHADYQDGDLRAWLRFSRGGEQLTWEHKVFGTSPVGNANSGQSEASLPTQGVGYQQLTLDLARRWSLTPTSSLELKGGYASTAYERQFTTPLNAQSAAFESHREEEYLLRATHTSQPRDSQSLALGAEYVYSRFGLRAPGYTDPWSATLGAMEPWGSSAVGLFGEHQWQWSDTLTQFLGLRGDKDEYSKWMWSPRWSLVYAPNEQDTYKTVISRSVRKNNAEELRKQHLAGQLSKPETLNALELIYQRALSPELKLNLSLFLNNAEVFGFDSTTLSSTRVADYSAGGAEFELGWKSENLRIDFSHSLTKLRRFSVEPGARQKISAAAQGYGCDLSNWSNQMSKLAASWQASPSWRLFGSLRVFWGYPGAQDMIDYTNAVNSGQVTGTYSATASSAPGYKDSTGPATFLDLGAEYRIGRQDSLSLNGYNLLGWLDKRNNKRMYLINVSNDRAEAAALALGYRHEF